MAASDAETVTRLEAAAAAGERTQSPAPNVTADTLGNAPAWDFRALAPWVLATWTCGVLLLTLRLAAGWFWVRHLRGHSASPARGSLGAVAARVARRLHVSRSVRLFESSIVDVPMVVGWLKPVILIPTSALAGLSPLQLEAILAHELAHVRRHDYLVNLVQTLVETLLFYHPAVWWVSKQIRIERENCCDDLAVSLCGDPILYAQALATLEHLRGSTSQLAMAATGGSLLHRVKRLLGAPSHAGGDPGWLAGTVSVFVIISISGVVLAAIGREAATRSIRSRQHAVAARAAHDRAADNVNVKNSVSQGVRERAHSLRDRLHQLREGAHQIRDGLHEIRRAMHEHFAQIPPPPPVPPEPPDPPAPPEPPDLDDAGEEPPEPPEMPEPPVMPELPVIPEPPIMAVPPQPPDPPAPPAFDELHEHGSSAGGRSSGNIIWSHNGERLEATYRGGVEFSGDGKDVKSLTPHGWLRITDSGWLGGHTMEFRANASGRIERRFYTGSRQQPFEPEGRKWMEQVLPRFIRQTGIATR
jgi:beta-lactamase regulating signal transducer with metallopeptidase domain